MRKATPTSIAPLCRQLSFMLGAGVRIKDVMTIMSDTPTKDSKQQLALRSATSGIMRGESLSSALEETGYFPGFMCNMCRIGEISDNLPKVMTLVADYYEEQARNREEIKSALLYPAIVASMMTAMIFVAVLYVLPNYALMFEASDVPLPALTRVLLATSNVLAMYWFLIIPATICVILAPVAFARTTVGRNWLESSLLYLPIYRQMINLHIVQALSLLLQSGQSLSDAVLAVSGVTNNKRIASDLQQLSAGLHEGTAFWLLLSMRPYIDQSLVGMARVGEETGNMASVFEQANAYSQYRFQQMSKRMNKFIEPAVTLILGLVLGLVMLSIILPTFAMTELVGF